MNLFKLKKALLVKNISSAFVYVNDRIKNSQVATLASNYLAAYLITNISITPCVFN
jgi:hypothetical protein